MTKEVHCQIQQTDLSANKTHPQFHYMHSMLYTMAWKSKILYILCAGKYVKANLLVNMRRLLKRANANPYYQGTAYNKTTNIRHYHGV